MPGYRTVEHRIPCQHIREYPRATANDQEDVLRLVVRQYIPEDNPDPQPGDVTIIAGHANGFPKELYEPLWDDLLSHAKKNNWRIRSIWMADVAHQGESYALNEQLLGNDPSWLDHTRDLLHLINVKREEMPRPIIGIGHSMGGAQMVNLAYIHPRLFTTLILIDPIIQTYAAEADAFPGSETPSIALLSTYRRDKWPSKAEAAKAFAKSPFYQRWDPRVFRKWIDHGLRDTPTVVHPSLQPPEVTLATPLPQELFQFIRPNYEGYGTKGKPMNRMTHPDVDPSGKRITPFYRPEPTAIFLRLGELRPPTLYIFGSESNSTTPELNELKVSKTGTGVGGSGGVQEGRVSSVTFANVGHLIAMEAVDQTAHEIGMWVGREIQHFRHDQDQWTHEWKPKPISAKQNLDDRWKKEIGPLPTRPKTNIENPSSLSSSSLSPPLKKESKI